MEAILEFLNKGVELAQNITFTTGDLDASGILGVVSKFLETLGGANLDFSSFEKLLSGINFDAIAELVTSIIKIA